MAAEWWGFFGRSWNFKRPLVFAYVNVIITKMLGVHRNQEIQARIMWQMDLWKRGLHTGLVRDAKAEGAAREVRTASGREEEDEAVARSYHDMIWSVNLRYPVRWV